MSFSRKALQVKSTGFQPGAIPGKAILSAMGAFKLMYSRNAFLIYPPCPWHLSWQQRGAGRTSFHGVCTAVRCRDSKGCQGPSQGPKQLALCCTVMSHTNCLPCLSILRACAMLQVNKTLWTPLLLAPSRVHVSAPTCGPFLPEIGLITIYLQGSLIFFPCQVTTTASCKALRW